MSEDEMVQCPGCTGEFSLQQEGVEFVDAGPNEYAAVCPYCGDLVDPEQD